MTPNKPNRSWPRRVVVATLRPLYTIMIRPVARPLASRLRAFFLGPTNSQIVMLNRQLADFESKFEAIALNLQRLESKAHDVHRSIQDLGAQTAADRERMRRLESHMEADRKSMQRLESNAIDIQKEISAMGRSAEAVLTSLSVASELR